MGRSVLFVHGTGVRGEGYARTLTLIRDRLADGIPLNGCFWGESAGARLNAGGASVPGYPDTGGGPPTQRERELALWAVLYTDPWYELRLLAERPGPTELAPGETPPAERLRRTVDIYVPSQALWELASGLPLDRALGELRSAEEFPAAARTARGGDVEHVRAIARAVVAMAVVLADEEGTPAPDGETRDALTAMLVAELGGDGRGIGEWLGRVVGGLAARVATHQLTRRRGGLTDTSVLAAGDIMRYQARGEEVRHAILRSIDATGSDEITLLAHSLGGVACVDLLVWREIPAVRGLITVGSQAPFLYEIGALSSLAYPAPLPAHFPRWLNVYDPRDVLSYVGAGLFADRVTDVRVDNGQPFPTAHGAYWANPEVWSAVRGFVAG